MFFRPFHKLIKLVYGFNRINAVSAAFIQNGFNFFFILHHAGYQKFFRYAGDEFIILVKAEEEKEVIEFESKLHDIADRFNRENDRPYKIGFSAGHALYDRENDTEDSFLKHIDTAMYKKKEIVHRERSLTIDRREQ